MNASSSVKKVGKSLVGVILLVLVILAAVAYFSNIISVSSFTLLAFVAATAVLIIAYFGWIAMPAGILFLLVAMVLTVGVTYTDHPDLKAGQYQAVTLTNGQVYFGHLKNIDTKHPVLADVYFLQSSQTGAQNTTTNNQTTAQQQPKIALIKLSSEISSPEDTMQLRSDQILSWENLQNSGKVAQAINKDLKK